MMGDLLRILNQNGQKLFLGYIDHIRRVMCEKHWIALQNAMYDGVLFSSDQI